MSFVPSALLCALTLAAPGPTAVAAVGDGGHDADTGTFELTAQVLLPPTLYGMRFFIETDDGIVPLVNRCFITNRTIRAGDVVRINADSAPARNGETSAPCALSMEFVAHAELPEAEQVSIGGLLRQKPVLNRVTAHGTITDIYRDDIDEKFGFMLLEDKGHEMEVPFCLIDDILERLTSLIGAKVMITGIIDPINLGREINRPYHFPRLAISGMDDIRVLATPPKDNFDVPELDDRWLNPPEKIASLRRIRASGRVLAVWRGAQFLLRDDKKRLFKAEVSGGALPVPGDTVDVTGIPETDLFDINLLRAEWRPTAPTSSEPAERLSMDVASLFVNDKGERRICTEIRGKTIVVCGAVKSVSSGETGHAKLILADGNNILNVESGPVETTFSGIEEGSVVEATGVCVIDSETYSARPIYPRVRGLFLVARGPEDIRVLSRPPWWTPTKFIAVIGLLASAIFGVLLWNRSLRRLAEHRGRKIAREEVKRAESELKVSERTRLAVELHDSIAQNLTGASMEIRAAKIAAREDEGQLDGHLDIAAATLDSCRAELRNCIWDLHSQALDQTSVEEAIRRTLEPHLGDARLLLRFNVPRTRFTDNTIHTVLRIIRELVINAVRHGHAAEINVEGRLVGGRLTFSVCDDGIGFDPSLSPGMEQGHFGLEGIRDRTALLNGSIKIDSEPGKGAAATVSLDLADPEEDIDE